MPPAQSRGEQCRGAFLEGDVAVKTQIALLGNNVSPLRNVIVGALQLQAGSEHRIGAGVDGGLYDDLVGLELHVARIELRDDVRCVRSINGNRAEDPPILQFQQL